MPAGKRLAPTLGELVPVLHRFSELVISDDTAALLVSMSAATIDRRLGPERGKHQLKGRARTKPGTLLKSQIPVHLGGLGRRGTRVRRDRPGVQRRRQRRRRPRPHRRQRDAQRASI